MLSHWHKRYAVFNKPLLSCFSPRPAAAQTRASSAASGRFLAVPGGIRLPAHGFGLAGFQALRRIPAVLVLCRQLLGNGTREVQIATPPRRPSAKPTAAPSSLFFSGRVSTGSLSLSSRLSRRAVVRFGVRGDVE